MAGRKGEKHWRDALRVAINRIREGDEDQRPMLARIAEKTVDLAMEGDMQAIKEIGDRLDGKAVQGIDDGEGGPVKLVIAWETPQSE